MTKANQEPKNAVSIDVAATADKKQLPWYRLPLVRRFFIGFLSLICAMFLWGYVLMSQNPNREKQFSGVTISFESGSEADLSARKLTVYGKVSEILRSVMVTVSAPLTDMTKLTSKDIIATVNLNDVHVAGSYKLEIKATSSVGTVTAIDPAYIEVEIDDVVDRPIPINYAFEGELPEGYWHAEPMLLSSSYTLSGASRDVERVSSAVCYIKLNELTDNDLLSELYNKSVEVVLLDSSNKVVESALFPNSLPSVTVRMQVLPYRDIPINFEVMDRDSLPDVFDIDSIQLNYDTIRIACKHSQLKQLSIIGSTPVHVSEISEVGVYNFALELHDIPDGAIILSSDQIRATVTVTEKIISKVFEQVRLEFEGMTPELGFAYSFDVETADITVSGPARMVNAFNESNIRLVVRVESPHLAGDYVLNIEIELVDLEQYEWFSLLNIEATPKVVNLKITRQSQQ